jgi:hypothetical protein
MTITAEQFKAATGREPEHDDLERVNCSKSGEIGHYFCGWDSEANRPQYEVGIRVKTRETAKRATPVLLALLETHLEISADHLELVNFWDCPESPTGNCVYDNVADPAWDDCLFCHQPHERK